MVEGTSLLRKHMGLNLYREFKSHRLRQEHVVEMIYSVRAARCGSRLLICAKASLVRFQIAEPIL